MNLIIYSASRHHKSDVVESDCNLLC